MLRTTVLLTHMLLRALCSFGLSLLQLTDAISTHNDRLWQSFPLTTADIGLAANDRPQQSPQLLPRHVDRNVVGGRGRATLFPMAMAPPASRQEQFWSHKPKLEKRVRPSKPLCDVRDAWLSRTCASADASARASPQLWLDTCLRVKPDPTGAFHWQPHMGRLKPPPPIVLQNHTMKHDHDHHAEHDLLYYRYESCPEQMLCMQLIDEHHQYHITCVPDPRRDLEHGLLDRDAVTAEQGNAERQVGYRALETAATGAEIGHDDFVMIEINIMDDFGSAAVTAGIISKPCH